MENFGIKNPERVTQCSATQCLYNKNEYCTASLILHDERGICKIFMPRDKFEKMKEDLKRFNEGEDNTRTKCETCTSHDSNYISGCAKKNGCQYERK